MEELLDLGLEAERFLGRRFVHSCVLRSTGATTAELPGGGVLL